MCSPRSVLQIKLKTFSPIKGILQSHAAHVFSSPRRRRESQLSARIAALSRVLLASARPRSGAIRESVRGMTLLQPYGITPRHCGTDGGFSERTPNGRQREDVASRRVAGDRSLACTPLGARTPPLDASARVTVTKRRTVSVSRCSAGPHPLPLRVPSRPFHPPSHFPPPPRPRGPWPRHYRLAQLSWCCIGAAWWRWKVGVHEPAEWGCRGSGGARDREPGRLLRGWTRGKRRGDEGTIAARGREIAKRPLEASTTCCHRCRRHHRRRVALSYTYTYTLVLDTYSFDRHDSNFTIEMIDKI